VPEYDPFAPEVMADPLPYYRALRVTGRTHPLPQYDAWAIPRFDDVWHALQDRDHLSIAEGPIFAREKLRTPNVAAPSTDVGRPLRSFATIDPPTHTRLRRAMLPPFLPRAVATLEADVRAHVRQLLDELVPHGRFDVVADLGSPVAVASTCRLLGLPDGERARLVALVNASTRREPGRSGTSAEGQAAQQELHGWISEWVRHARGSGGIVDLLAAFDAGDDPPLTDAEIAVQLSTLLVGGTETLPKILAGGVLRLWRHPEQRASLVADRDLLAGAFEEIMRLESVLQWVGRTVLVDTELAGRPMRAGQRVFLLLVSANHDEREFTDPERFDIARTMPRTLVFGHGVHVCIGAHAARLAGRVLLDELVVRLPGYDVDLAGVERPPSEFQVGYTAMPLVC
jgi:cytochrome P450